MDLWAYWKKVKLDFSRPGKPKDNATIESLNARLRKDYLNAHWSLSMDDARRKIQSWRQDYKVVRPHSSLQNMTSTEFASRHRPTVPATPPPPAHAKVFCESTLPGYT